MASPDVTLEELQAAIRNVPDFPEEGIQFKDITPVLADARLLDGCISHLLGGHSADTVDVVAGIDARGFNATVLRADSLGHGWSGNNVVHWLAWLPVEADACNIRTDRTDRYLLSAYYSEGRVAVHNFT